MKRAAIYVRVSTVDQDVDMQVPDLVAYCKSRAFEIVDIIEDKKSGKNEQRNGFQHLMDLVRKRKVDVVVVWKLSRFGRSFTNAVSSFQELDDLGIQFVAYKENIDTETPMGKMVRNILAAIAEWQREDIVSNIKAGINHAQRHGTKSGRPIGRKPIGHTEIKETIILTETGELNATQVQRKTGVSKSSYYKIIGVYNGLKKNENEAELKKKLHVSDTMMNRIKGVIKSLNS